VSRNGTRNDNSITWDRRSDQSKVPSVYFDLVTFPTLPTERPRIKIGKAGDHEKRRQQHSKAVFGLPINAKHLCVVRGTAADEDRVQQYFIGCRVSGEEETFWPENELIDYIRWLRDQWFVWVSDDEHCPPIEELECVEASLWMPRPERRVPSPREKQLFSECGVLNLPPRQVTIDDFFTSDTIMAAVRKTLGAIDLDPASHAVANRIVKAKEFYTAATDGLTRQWKGRVWLNPPFSQWEIWVPKIIGEWQGGCISAMCVLCATRTLTAKYLSPIHKTCSAICILYGRIAFWGARAATPDDGHAIFYFGADVERFRQVFGEIGFVYQT